MAVNCKSPRKETADSGPDTCFHTVNKTLADTTAHHDRPATATFIVSSVFATVEVVCAVSLLVSVSPPIRSVADFGGVNEQYLFIRGVKTPIQSARSLWTRILTDISDSLSRLAEVSR